MLADARGHMPESLKIEGYQRFFEHGLDQVDWSCTGTIRGSDTRARHRAGG